MLRTPWLRLTLAYLLLTLVACGGDDDKKTTPNDVDMNVGMSDGGASGDATPVSDGGLSDMDPSADAAPRAMPEGMGDLWRLQINLVEFGVEVPFQLELKRGENQFDFARLRSVKDGMISEPINWVFDVPIQADGTFAITFDRMTIPGAFSPTLDDVEIGLVITATDVDGESFCGTITGDVFTLETPVSMSTFGAVPWGGEAPFPAACAGEVETFDPIAECPMLVAGDNADFPSAGLQRSFRVFLPENYDATQSWPLVLGYHGKNGEETPGARIDKFIRESQLPTSAVGQTSILVMPASQGIGSEWESGGVGPTRDLAFFDDLVTCLKESFSVDDNRIHVLGHSAGGYQAAMLTLARGDLLASSALVSTGLLFEYAAPRTQIPVMAIWGGEEDISFMQDFHRQTAAYVERFSGAGHIVLACRHDSLPLEGDNSRHTWQPPTNDWIADFFRNHPKGTMASPYVMDGVPAGWASECELHHLL